MNRNQQSKHRRTKKHIAAGVLIICVAAALFLIFNAMKAQDVKLASVQTILPVVTSAASETEAPVTAAVMVSVTPAVASAPAQTDAAVSPTPAEAPSPSPTVKEEQSPLLSEMLQKYRVSADNISQLLMLAYRSGGSKLYLYDKNSSGLWVLKDSFPANVGLNGITINKKEGDKKTPTGFYAIGFAFGNEYKPDTKWTYRKVTVNSYWVDDPNSVYYNSWVEGTKSKDWNSAEHLSDETTAYAYAMVIEYNTDPIVPGKGSAIFLHCGANPTVGCISVGPSNLLKILKWLDPKSNAHILIADAM